MGIPKEFKAAEDTKFKVGSVRPNEEDDLKLIFTFSQDSITETPEVMNEVVVVTSEVVNEENDSEAPEIKDEDDVKQELRNANEVLMDPKSPPPKPTRKRKGRGRGQKQTKSEGTKPKVAPKPKKPVEEQKSVLTDYFPVRRSVRVPARELKRLEQKRIEEAILSDCIDGLKVEQFPLKGRGVVAEKSFRKGEFVVEYSGDLIDLDTAKQRDRDYTDKSDVGCYMYYFNHRNKAYCIDATAESGKLGRLLNHSKINPNCCTRVVDIDGTPYLIIVAARDISVGDELLYDYGDRNKETLAANPWLAY